MKELGPIEFVRDQQNQNQARAALFQLLIAFFIHRQDVVAALHPVTGKPCPVRATDLAAAVAAHVFGPEVPPVALRFVTGGAEVEFRGHFRLGAYTLDVDNTVKWACWDLDGAGHKAALADPTGALVRLRQRHRDAGLDLSCERSGGANGWHGWVFFDKPIPATLVRQALLPLTLTHELLSGGGVADVRRGQGIELFPKQDALREKNGERGFGNLVWLPGWHGAKPGGNQFYDVDDAGAATPITPPSLVIVTGAHMAHIVPPPPTTTTKLRASIARSETSSARPMSWTSNEQLSLALAEAIRRHATSNEGHGSQRRINAFWRGGDGANVTVDLSKAVWKDHKTGDGGGVRELANRMGMTLPAFLREYAGDDVRAAPAMSPIFQERAPLLTAAEIPATWEKLSAGCCGKCRGCRYDDGCLLSRGGTERVWLQNARGIPHSAVIDSGVAALNEETLSAFPHRARRWARDKAGLGALVVPLRSASSNAVRNLVIRPFSPTDPKRKSFLLPGTKMRGDRDEPLGYGFAGAVNRTARVLLTEGLVDTLVLEAAFRADHRTVVVGVVSASDFSTWARFLSDTRVADIVLVPHLDGDVRGDAYGTGQDAVVKAIARLRAASRRAFRFSWNAVHGELIRIGVSDAVNAARDLGDVAKFAAAGRLAWDDVVRVVSRGVEVACG